MQTTISIDFAIGDEAYTINTTTMKLVNFHVGKITVYIDSDGERSYLHPDEDSKLTGSFYASKCYHSKEDLMSHLLED